MPHSSRSRNKLFALAILILLAALFAFANPLLSARITHAASAGELVFLEVHSGWCCMCAGLDTAFRAALPQHSPWTIVRTTVRNAREQQRAIALLDRTYGIDVRGHGFPIYAAFANGTLLGYGTGFDNQDLMIGFYPKRTPVFVRDVIEHPQRAITYSQTAQYAPIPPAFV